jgi:hypothetical protein
VRGIQSGVTEKSGTRRRDWWKEAMARAQKKVEKDKKC